MRLSKPLGGESKVTFSATPVMASLLEDMARARGISRAELLRRIAAQAILDSTHPPLRGVTHEDLGDLEHLAALAG